MHQRFGSASLIIDILEHIRIECHDPYTYRALDSRDVIAWDCISGTSSEVWMNVVVTWLLV
jgi:hypothetical protein